MGVTLNAGKTRFDHVWQELEFLGYKIDQGQRPLRLPASKITGGVRAGPLYAILRGKSIRNCKDQIPAPTRRNASVTTRELIGQIHPFIRGWGRYYRKVHVRGPFHRLNGWIVRRIWSHRYGRWRNGGWTQLAERMLGVEYGLGGLIAGAFLETSLGDADFNAAYGKLYGPFERRPEASPPGRLLRTDSDGAGEQAGGWRSGVGGVDAPGQRKF